jgi:adenylate cyclase
MQNSLTIFNKRQRKLNLPELAMGIGVNTGNVIVGNVGSEKRASYGAVGSPINIAFRIESFTVGGQILISPSTFDRVKSLVQLNEIIEAQFKGLSKPLTLYDVSGMGGDYQLSLTQKNADSLDVLENPIPIYCFPIEEKAISGNGIAGHIICFGDSSAHILLEKAVTLLTNLKIQFAPHERRSIPEAYAKVVPFRGPKYKSSQTQIHIKFTWITEDTKKYIEKSVGVKDFPEQ